MFKGRREKFLQNFLFMPIVHLEKNQVIIQFFLTTPATKVSSYEVINLKLHFEIKQKTYHKFPAECKPAEYGINDSVGQEVMVHLDPSTLRKKSKSIKPRRKIKNVTHCVRKITQKFFSKLGVVFWKKTRTKTKQQSKQQQQQHSDLNLFFLQFFLNKFIYIK